MKLSPSDAFDEDDEESVIFEYLFTVKMIDYSYTYYPDHIVNYLTNVYDKLIINDIITFFAYK